MSIQLLRYLNNLKCVLLYRTKYNHHLVARSKKTKESRVTMKFLNVAEKNDAAKNIALHLSRGTSRRREGLSQYNKIYEFEADVLGQNSQMVMTSVSGHLLGLEFVSAYKGWQSCDPLALFDAPVFKYCPENYEKIKKTLERKIRSCQGLIIWTDCDREGENIGFEVIQVCTAIKNNIRIYRAKFSEITSVSVRRALQNLEEPNKNISDAVDVRQELDLRIGAAFTRFQTLRLQKVFPSKLADSLISYGSCQFPTLGFVVERYRAVENFVAEPFWKIIVNHTMNGLSVDFSWERVRLFDRASCAALLARCRDEPRARVAAAATRHKAKWRPLPLDTVELEKLASRKLKINAKETMRIAEKLYTQGFISYPRTETNEYPKEMNLAQLVGYQVADAAWGGFAQGILDGGGPEPRQGNKSDKAHPPIHPTKYTNSLQGNEARVYEFIVRSFLACCSRDARGRETAVTLELAGERFSASGLVVTARNYLDVYPYDKWSSKEIHLYEEGQTFDPTSIDMVDGSTSPPNLLTEADLIALMEKHGIGTDATHAEHIETIKSRSYVCLAEASFVPGVLGMGLVEGYDGMGLALARPLLRAKLEADLKEISEGRKRPELVLAEQIAIYKEVYLKAAAEANKIDAALAVRFSEQPNEYVPPVLPNMDMTPVLKCPKCGSDMVVRQKKSNPEEFYVGCVSFPACRAAAWLPAVVRSVQVLPDTCPTCGPNYKKIKLEWRNNSISHLYPPPYIACIGGCDTTFLELMKINLSSVRNVPNRNETAATNTAARPQPTTNATRNNTNPFTIASRTNPTNQNPVPQNRPMPVNPLATDQARAFVPPTDTNRTVNATNWNTNTASSRTTNANAIRFPTPRSSGESEDNNVLCACNQQAILLTVRKQNANFGKKFYKCPQGKENGGCDFFLWAPESVDQAASNADTPPASNTWGTRNNDTPDTNGWGVRNDAPVASNSWGNRNNQRNNDTRGDGGDDVQCNCGLPCKRLTVQKEGPNKGRPFYGCAKEYSERCNFFQWADDAPAAAAAATGANWGGASGSENYRGRGRGRGGGAARGGGRGGAGAAGGGARRCGLCRQEGHTRNRCPNQPAD